MKVLSLCKNVMNIQKCLLPDCEYLRKNYGSYCLITIPETFSGILVRIGLCEPKQITGGFFVDSSVFIYETSDKTKHSVQSKSLDFEHFRLLPSVTCAQTINVRIIFSHIVNLNKKNQCSSLKQITKEILKFYTFSTNSVIFLDNLTIWQRNGIYCIDIISVNGQAYDGLVNVFQCSESSDVIIKECVSRKKYEVCHCFKEEIKLGGLSKAYGILKEIIDFSKTVLNVSHNIKFSNKILLTGPTGCGKTSLVQNVIKECKSVLIEVLLSDLGSSLPGESEEKLHNVFEEARLHTDSGENCVILIEDIDVLCAKRKDNASSNSKRIINKLVSLLEDLDNYFGIVVIGTTTNIDDVDPQLRRAKRFDDELEIITPTVKEREEIISNIMDYFKIKCSSEVVKNFALWTPGFVGADLLLVVQECIVSYHKMKEISEEMDNELLESCFKKKLTNTTPTSLKETVGFQITKDINFSKIGGLHNIKKLLNLSVKQQLLNPEAFTRMGIPFTKGILLYGPPGCAKTTLVKALANECNMTFLWVSSADLYSPYVGDPEKKILQLFSQARMGTPAIIFIDEIDGLVGSKSGDRIHGVQERVLSTLLVEMDGISVGASRMNSALKLLGDTDCEKSKNNDSNAIIVIGATNRPERLDDALKRPGRFDKIVYVPPPDKLERFNILKKLTEKMPLNKNVDLEYIAERTDFYSGADLKNLCYDSALLALTESEMKANSVDASHFQQVLARTRPSLNVDMIKYYESFQKNLH